MAKPKAITVELIPVERDGKRSAIYAMADALIDSHHPHLRDARIAFAWNLAWSEDTDGKVILGQAKRTSDLDRELHGFDFIILLNGEWIPNFQPEQVRAVIDHELCHCEVAKDADSEVRSDERGRTVWRVRTHDVEEFREVIARHGLYKSDLEQLAETMRDAKVPAPLFDAQKLKKQESPDAEG